jgi:succinoglycan biosynthesis transport protein ExoP
VDPTRAAALVRRRIRLIVVLMAIAGGTAFVVSQLLPKSYESETWMLVGSLTETSPDALAGYQHLAQTYAEVAVSTTVLDRVIGRLGLQDDAEELAKRIDIRTATGQSIIRITATDPSPTGAAQIANALGDEIITFATPTRTTTVPGSLATVFQPALPPQTAAGPRVLLNTIIGILVGFFVGLGVALLLGDRTFKRRAPEPSAGEVVGTIEPRPRAVRRSKPPEPSAGEVVGRREPTSTAVRRPKG